MYNEVISKGFYLGDVINKFTHKVNKIYIFGTDMYQIEDKRIIKVF
jgi:hypothetical protein